MHFLVPRASYGVANDRKPKARVVVEKSVAGLMIFENRFHVAAAKAHFVPFYEYVVQAIPFF